MPSRTESPNGRMRKGSQGGRVWLGGERRVDGAGRGHTFFKGSGARMWKRMVPLFRARARRSRYVEVLLDVVLGDGAFVAVSTIFTPVVPIVSFYGVAFEVAPGGLRYRPFSHLYLPPTTRGESPRNHRRTRIISSQFLCCCSVKVDSRLAL